MPIAQGTRLGHYEIRSLLGAGGMGEVFLADDLSLHRPVAVRVLRAALITNEDRLQRFEREAYAASSLNHPNIITIYEIGVEDDLHFIVTEFIEGESLGQRLLREPIELLEALKIGIQLTSALSAAHAAGMIHGDIKPDNIMVRHDQVAKVLDFGLAKLNEQANAAFDPELPHANFSGAVMGTVSHMSPEQARGEAVDAQTDIWSLGVVLYEMVAGHLPFTGETPGDILASVVKTDPPPLTAYVTEAPAEMDRIVTRALRKDPEKRYQSMKDLGLDLKTLKQRLEFEAELRRSGSTKRGNPDKVRGEERVVRPKQPAKEKPPARTVTDRPTRQVHATSTAAYLRDKIRRHKQGAILTLAAVLLLTIVGGYFAYSRYRFANPPAGITSLAVLPFTNAGNDPEKEYLSDGISESLINQLSQLPGIKVIANTSSSKYKGQNADPQDVARALDVGAVLTGKVQQHGDAISISVELVDARDRTHLWGEQYNRKATDVLAVLAEISSEIVEKLRLRLTAVQQKQVATSGRVNPEAYELLLKGRFYHSRGGAENRKKALEYFNQAIAVDPAYALPYAELSNSYRALVSNSILDPKEYLPKAEAAARKALDLDESLADAHYAQANLKAYRWEWEDAERDYQRAIELNPNLADAHRYYARFLSFMGRHGQALDQIKRAKELDPLSPAVYVTLGHILYNARQYDQAIEVLQQTLALDQKYSGAYWFLGYCYSAKGMYAPAINAFQEAIKLGQDAPATQIRLGSAYAQSGNRAQAQAILKQLQTSKEYVSPFELALLYAALGERDQAFASLEKAYEAHDVQFQFLGVSPEWDPMRSDPRFQDLVRRIGLTP